MESFSIKKRIKSFHYAFAGLKVLLKEEHNARIHLFVTFVVIALGGIFNLSSMEWVSICLVIAMVFALELLNSAIENLADFVSPDKHEKIKKVKDLAAAAVFVGAICAIVVGLIIFLPKIITLSQ